MRWLITGGCGFIGTALIKRLAEDGGHVIKIIDNLSVGTREALDKVGDIKEIAKQGECNNWDQVTIELVIGDVVNQQLAMRAASGIDIIVHLAANTGVRSSLKKPRGDFNTNVTGIFNYLEAARYNGVKRFIFASSGASLGEVEPPVKETLAPKPVSPYGAGKLAGEGYCSAYARSFGINTVALRFGNVYGPGSSRKTSVISKFIKQALVGEPIEIYGNGSQTRDFIYIQDIVKAIYLAAECNVYGEIFQIATQRETTVNEIANCLKRLIDPLEVAPAIKITYSHPRSGDVLRNFSDISRAREVLGWMPNTSLEKGLKLTIDWFLNNRNYSGD